MNTDKNARNLHQLHISGASPSEMVRYLRSIGQQGANVVIAMRVEPSRSLSGTKAISAWLDQEQLGIADDDALNRDFARRSGESRAQSGTGKV